MFNSLAAISPQLAAIAQLLWFLLVFAFVIVLAVVFTRWIAGARFQRGLTGNLHVLESVSVGQQVYLQLVRAGNKYFVIGVTRASISYICELAEDEVRIPDCKAMGGSVVAERFEKYLKTYLQKKPVSEEDSRVDDKK